MIRSGRHAVPGGPLCTVLQEVELARGVRVAVDAEEAARVEGQLDQLVRRVLALRPGVDLDGDLVFRARRKHLFRVELRRRTRPP